MDRPPAFLAELLLLADSALPVGAFSHSFGLETLFAHRQFGLGDPELIERLSGRLWSEWGGVDGPAFSLAHQRANQGDVSGLTTLDRLVDAMRLPAEWRRAGRQMGRQLVRLDQSLVALGAGAQAMGDGTARETLDAWALAMYRGESPGQYAVAAGGVYAARGVPLPEALAAFAMSSVVSAVTVAVRLVPLGQVEGQALVRKLWARLVPAVERAASAQDVTALGGFAPVFEIEGMEHETLETRLFIS